MQIDLENTLVYTIPELAKILKISLSTAYQMARADGFPKVRINKRILVPAEELKVWLRKKCNSDTYDIKKF